MDISSMSPASGRMMKENGEVINLADIWDDIAAGAGLVKPTNYLYVSKGGNDTAGDGSANFPYLTVSAALTVATSGTTIFIFPGNYAESLTLKAGVNLTSPAALSVYIAGNHTANFTGTVIIENIVLSSASGITLTYSGTGIQNLQFYTSSINSVSGDAINWTNTNANSKLQMIDCTCNVTASGASARCFYSTTGATGGFIANRTTFRLNNPDNVCFGLGGAVSFTHTSDQIVGQVVVANTASATIAQVAMITSTVPVLAATSSGATTLVNNTITTTSSPAVSGAGVLTYVALLYTSTGVGGAATLNGGLGAISLPMSSVKIRASALVPAGQVAVGQNSGAIEFDGTHWYVTAGTTRTQFA